MGQDDLQPSLFEVPPDWAEHWQGMPQFEQKNLMPWQTVKIHFRNRDDRLWFETLLGQRMTDETKYLWFPPEEIEQIPRPLISNIPQTHTQYPLYIISKGRWDSRLTSKSLERLAIPYSIVIEPQEYEMYAAVIDKARILTLPFSNLGQGSIPARNWVWEHASTLGYAAHWIIDDNIDGFARLQNNKKKNVYDENPFYYAEKLFDLYTNIGLLGFNYRGFAKARQKIPAFYLNTRIYSCILVNHHILHRWRGRYNEDTDLSLRVLKDGWCTVLLNAFLINKAVTMSLAGGNTDELYKDDGRLLMAQSLQAQHPDVVTITEKWGRAQHQVNYKPFRRNKLRPKRCAQDTPPCREPETAREYTQGQSASLPSDDTHASHTGCPAWCSAQTLCALCRWVMPSPIEEEP